MNAFNESERGLLKHPNEYDCARNHYTIIKTAYDLGYEHILVMEDDIRFLKDANIFNMYLKRFHMIMIFCNLVRLPWSHI